MSERDSSWTPISKPALEKLIADELEECPEILRDVFERHRVKPYLAPISRFGGETDQVFVAARRGDEVMYFNDIEWGWNFSPLPDADSELEHWCNQDELKYALWRWCDRGE